MMAVGKKYIRATTLFGFRELVENAGGDPAALLIAAGIDVKLLDNPDGLMSYEKLGNLMEIAARELSRPSLALEWVLNSPEHAPNHGPLMMLARFTSTLQEWIDTGSEYWKYHTNAFTMQQMRDEKTNLVAFRYARDSATFSTRQLTEAVLANICRMARVVAKHTDKNPDLVRFQHAKPRDTSLHERAFRCPIEFGAEHDEIVFNPDFLQYQTNGNLKLFKPLLGYYIKSRIDRMQTYDQSMTETVRLAIASVAGSGHCSIAFVSESLGLTPKKLRRLLAAEGTTFSEVLEKVRENMARKFLSETNAPIGNIAGLLDYSTTAPFSLAFKRWTGKTPHEFRKDERQQLAAQES
jgi:AraC-like DNA-binding protein